MGSPRVLPDRFLTRAEISARYRAAHPNAPRRHRRADPEVARRWRAANPDRVALHERRKSLKARYGITIEQYDDLLRSQGGACAICGAAKAGGHTDTLQVDHDHLTGRIRGLLCFRCNRALGVIESARAPLYFAYLSRTS